MEIPSVRAVWSTIGHQLRRPLGRLPRPSRRGAVMLLVLIAAGAIVVPRLPEVMKAQRRADHLAGPESSRPTEAPPEDQRGAGFRPARDAVTTSSVENAVQPQPASSAGARGESTGIPWGRRIIRRANLAIELADVERGISRLAEVVEDFGGYLAETQSHTDATGTLRATITAYVPPERFGRALAGLEGLGRVTSRRIAGQDVSEEFVDLEARVRNLERHEGQLLAFMNKAQKVADLLSLENELARVRGEIERLAGRIRFLKARTEMASIQVSLVRAPVATPPDDVLARVWEQVRTAFLEAWHAAFRVAAALIVLAAQASPLSVPALAAWALYRRWARRRPLPSPPAPTA